MNIPRAYFGNTRPGDVHGARRVKASKINARAKPLGRMGLKRLDTIFTALPLKVTVAIVLEKLSGTSGRIVQSA